MESLIELNIEQQFKLESLKMIVKDLNEEQAQIHLIETYRLLMMKDNLIKNLLKEINPHEPEKIEEYIIDLLLEKGIAMSFDEIYAELSIKQKLSEREVKETIWKLLEDEKIIPNKHWKMEINNGTKKKD